MESRLGRSIEKIYLGLSIHYSTFIQLTRLNDYWLRLIGITLLVLVSVSLTNYLNLPFSWVETVNQVLIIIEIVVTWEAVRLIIFTLRERYIHRKQVLLRLFFTFVAGTVSMALIHWILSIARYWLRHRSLDDFTNYQVIITVNGHGLSFPLYGIDFVQAGILFLLFLGGYEALFFVLESRQMTDRLQQAKREKEALEKTNLQSQLEALKQQVNPHFLFNSLNALGTLIEEDPKQASLFLDELSTVYRYLLRSNEHNLTTLAAELDFIHSYAHLLRTRYGSGLRLSVNVDSRHEAYQLPPLTLQLLVENAVKHNIILPEEPLTITISTNALHQLIITNNLQRKNAKIHSNGLGLNNILTKYRMLGQDTPTVHETETQFAVFLPLIE